MSEMPDGDVQSWLFSIARDVFRNVPTSRPRCPQCGWAHLDHRAGGREVEDDDPFDGLDEDDRELLRLQAWEGLTTPQLAAATGLSARAVAVRLDAVRERIPHVQLPAEPRDDEMWMPDPEDER
jgi:RNA polymerase sigma-70 factor (ECF subfamily)